MRYFFDIRDNFYAADDEDGVEYSDSAAARREALKVATSIAEDLFIANGSEISVTVRDKDGPLFELIVNLQTKELR
ncbi:MAG: hypothetical protein WA418_05940 [Bradyrhizobium sp.]